VTGRGIVKSLKTRWTKEKRETLKHRKKLDLGRRDFFLEGKEGKKKYLRD